MDNLLLKTISPQSAKVYNLLLRQQPLSAKEIAQTIGIVTNTAYRDLRELIKLGLAEEVNQYPKKFQAKPEGEALELYSSIIRNNFYETFGLRKSAQGSLKVSFFETRKDFLKLSEKDSNHAKKQINLIISGHEVPAETMLAKKKAADKGVKIKILIQGLDEERKRVTKAWQKIGAEVRYISNMNTRILIYDSQITYFSSYDPGKQPEAVGVRFDYPPFAKLMDEMFEQKWQQARSV